MTAIPVAEASATAPAFSSQAEAPEPLHTFELAKRSIAIRLLRHADCALLEWHGGADLRAFYQEQWSRHQGEERTVLVACFNGYPCGQAAVHWDGKPTHPGIPDIQSVRVHPAFRGQSVGSHLLAGCERLGAARHFQRISLSVGTQNSAARRLYERHGYRVVDEPYLDVWHYANAAGENVRVEEMVLDMLKGLGG